jgi:hypothetical protein
MINLTKYFTKLIFVSFLRLDWKFKYLMKVFFLLLQFKQCFCFHFVESI